MTDPAVITAKPDPGTQPDPRRWKALALLCTAFFMVILDSAIVLVALPSIDADLAFSAGNLQWVLSAYLLSFGGLLLLGGRAADLLGRRRMFIAGTGLFALASLGAGLAGTTAVLLAARAVQGVAAAIMTPTALSILMTTFPEGAERNQALGRLGLDRRHRRNRGVARRRPDHRRPRLAVDLLPQRAGRRDRGRAEPGAPAREPCGGRAAALRRRRRGDDHGRAGRAGLRGRRGPAGRLGRRADARPAGAGGGPDRALRRHRVALGRAAGAARGVPLAVARRRQPRAVRAGDDGLRRAVHPHPVRPGGPRLVADPLRARLARHARRGGGRDRQRAGASPAGSACDPSPSPPWRSPAWAACC